MYRRFSDRLLKRKLAKVDSSTINRFSFNGISTYARICKVYDGDTVTIIFQYKGEMIKYSCRIYGIDTPEIRTKDLDEKKRGYEARDFLKSYIDDQIVKIDLFKFDKYGRLLGTIYANVGGTYKDVARLMIDNNHGKPYFGGTKTK